MFDHHLQVVFREEEGRRLHPYQGHFPMEGEEGQGAKNPMVAVVQDSILGLNSKAMEEAVEVQANLNHLAVESPEDRRQEAKESAVAQAEVEDPVGRS